MKLKVYNQQQTIIKQAKTEYKGRTRVYIAYKSKKLKLKKDMENQQAHSRQYVTRKNILGELLIKKFSKTMSTTKSRSHRTHKAFHSINTTSPIS